MIDISLRYRFRQGLNLEINPYSDEKFRYLQKQIDLLLVMGNAIVNNWSRFSKDVTDDSFDKFMDLIQLATHHPVKVIILILLLRNCPTIFIISLLQYNINLITF